MKTKQKFTRKFLGELFPKRENANYEKAHLRAYLKGHTHFCIGRYPDGSKMYGEVKQELIPIN